MHPDRRSTVSRKPVGTGLSPMVPSREFSRSPQLSSPYGGTVHGRGDRGSTESADFHDSNQSPAPGHDAEYGHNVDFYNQYTTQSSPPEPAPSQSRQHDSGFDFNADPELQELYHTLSTPNTEQLKAAPASKEPQSKIYGDIPVPSDFSQQYSPSYQPEYSQEYQPEYSQEYQPQASRDSQYQNSQYQSTNPGSQYQGSQYQGSPYQSSQYQSSQDYQSERANGGHARIPSGDVYPLFGASAVPEQPQYREPARPEVPRQPHDAYFDDSTPSPTSSVPTFSPTRSESVHGNSIGREPATDLRPSISVVSMDRGSDRASINTSGAGSVAPSHKSSLPPEPVLTVPLPTNDAEATTEQALGIGTGSTYVRYLRNTAGVTVTGKTPSKLPIGVVAGSVAPTYTVPKDFVRKAMDIRYTHLQPRMLASEVDDDDDDSAAAAGGASPLAPAAIATGASRRSSSSAASVCEEVGKIKLFVANPDSDSD